MARLTRFPLLPPLPPLPGRRPHDRPPAETIIGSAGRNPLLDVYNPMALGPLLRSPQPTNGMAATRSLGLLNALAQAWVRNVIGTAAEPKCPCGGWMNHCARHDAPTNVCQAAGCPNAATEGAHVVRADLRDRCRYVVATCREHNHHDAPYPLRFGARLVPADARLVCGRYRLSAST